MTAGTVTATLTTLAVFVVAVLAVVEDVRSHRLRNVHTTTIAAIASVGFAAASVTDGTPERLVAMAAGALLYALPWLVLHLIEPDSVGFGDVKYAAALGVGLGWLDPVAALWAVLVACIGFTVWLVTVRRGRNDAHPFGPALLLGAVGSALLVLAGA